MRKHAQVDLDVRDLEERISGSKRAEEKAAEELDALEREIKESRNELETLRLSYNHQMVKEEEMTQGKRSLAFCIKSKAVQLSSLTKFPETNGFKRKLMILNEFFPLIWNR
ncbi:hypothetical protein MKW92_035236 [Papaver armeniacum]|nr:hypothetical protein MKW92_035236 [Papaver armeniacum]